MIPPSAFRMSAAAAVYLLLTGLALLGRTAAAAAANQPANATTSVDARIATASTDRTEKHGDAPKSRICIGTSGRMSVPANREHHYRNLRDRYTNCTYVDGNLEITWIQDENIDLSFLKHIREVTGYVLMSHVDVHRIVLPELQIIRGRTLFKLNIQEDAFALMVTLSKMHTLELPGLRDILAGSVGFFNNYNLCHVKTINWDEILTGPNAHSRYIYNFTNTERECPPCHKSCTAGCWGEGQENCQRFSKINCSPQCFQGRCFGPEPRQCCHLFCAGGCSGPKQTDCLACRDVYDDGVCTQECPPMNRYNPITYSWETNPSGKYAYGATCVKNCPEHLLKDSGACVKSCPPNKKAENGECKLCEGLCPKTCKGVTQINNANVDDFKDCTVIEGSITILDSTFKGYHDVDENFNLGRVIPPMSPDKLEVFSSLREITGYLNIQGAHENFTSLSFLRNLQVIGGRELTPSYFASLYIVKTTLRYLGLTSLKKIQSGGVAILENEHLCYTENMDWKKIKKSVEHGTLLLNNKKFEKCQNDSEVCDVECAKEGCWGPGPDQCISCKNFKYENQCILNCDAIQGLYRANTTHCMACHQECQSVCHGPGPANCKLCKNVRDGAVCAPYCPEDKYNSSDECKACHSNCVNGCRGPENNIGPNGCVSCQKAVINGNAVERCLQSNESCPDGFYSEWQGPNEFGMLKPLAGKEICRRCHPRCRKCTGYGFHEPVCLECVHYKRDQICEEECPSNFYPDNSTHQCLSCSSECIDCTGPGTTDCVSCRNLMVYLPGSARNSNSTSFNCTHSCPPEVPFAVVPEDNGKPYCSADMSPVMGQVAYSQQWPFFTVGCIFALIIGGMVVIVVCKRQQQEKKENDLKMTMIFNGIDDDRDRLHQTDAKPNMRILKIFKENQIRKGHELGSGAFGRVYQGVLYPDKPKKECIPVAIKVLKEGTRPEKNKETLEEAYIMATVHHKYLLTLIGVCMTHEMMIITPLMPLGCLLDFVQRNKAAIGPKKMLTWCQQIAEGMAYLEERKLIHRDLAARNVLLASNQWVKITDFGLARLLDMNEEEYKADGSKVPVKWLALECIRHKIFTHKSDVWAFGVTIWELLTFGQKPYGNIPHTDVPELLEKGERLPQPRIATMEVYKTMLSCWFLSPESRPTFQELKQEFEHMLVHPAKYLMVTVSDERLPDLEELELRDCDVSAPIDSEEYLQPSCSNMAVGGVLPFAPGYPAHLHSLKESVTTSDSGGSGSKREVQIGNIKLDLPLDDDDYLMPSPQRSQSLTTTATSAAYMDLINDSKSSDENQNTRLPSSVKPFGIEFMQQQQQQQPHPCVYNLEYHLVNDQKLGIPQVHQLQHRSSEEESDHEYYNDFDRLQRELQPLRRNRNETPV